MLELLVHLQSALHYLHSRLFSTFVYPLSCGGILVGENASGEEDLDYLAAGGDAGGNSGSAIFANRIG